MSGDCSALRIFTEGMHVDAILANYGTAGITGIKVALGGDSDSFGTFNVADAE